MEETIISTGKAAKILGLSIRTVNLLIDNGRLKGWRLPDSTHRRTTIEEVTKLKTEVMNVMNVTNQEELTNKVASGLFEMANKVRSGMFTTGTGHLDVDGILNRIKSILDRGEPSDNQK